MASMEMAHGFEEYEIDLLDRVSGRLERCVYIRVPLNAGPAAAKAIAIDRHQRNMIGEITLMHRED